MSFASFISWVLPFAVTLIGSLLGLLKYLNERQEKSAAGLRAALEILRTEMNAGDDANHASIEACKAQQHQAAASLRLLIAEQREKMAEQRADIADKVLNKDDFRDFGMRLEERLGRLEVKIDHLGQTARA